MVGHHQHIGLDATSSEFRQNPTKLGGGGQGVDGRRGADPGRVLRLSGSGNHTSATSGSTSGSK